MTREEEIRGALNLYAPSSWDFRGETIPMNKDELQISHEGFVKGAKWADKNPKSPWISVKDDLPCNHKELLLSTGCHTVGVFTYKKGGACCMDNMIIRNGKWEWEAWKEDYLYWMPIPKLHK